MAKSEAVKKMSAKTSHEMRRVRSLAAISIVGGVLFALMVTGLHFLPTGYNPVDDVVSDYAVGPYGGMMDLAFAAAGIAGISLATALLRLKESQRLYRYGTILLFIAGSATFLLGVFPIDLKGAAMTTNGAVHSLASLIVFVFQPIGIILVSR
jgi:hypothetical membrane protein